jgi:MFS family permease
MAEKTIMDPTGSATSSQIEEKYGSDVSAENAQDINERRLLRKVDLRLIPLLVAIHAICLVDRSNISVARISGMDEDLKLETRVRASIVTSTFFIGYILFNIPSNAVIRRIGPARFMGTITIGWGLATLATGFVSSWIAAAVLRAIIGFFEAGNGPGSIYLTSAYYRRYEVQKRLAAYFLGSLFLQGFSNIFAYGLIQIGNDTNWKGWRFIYIIEGAMTILIGFAAYRYLIDFPDSPKTKFLTNKEKTFINERLSWDRGSDERHEVTLRSIAEDLRDWKVWACAWIYFSATVGTYALAFFLPTILKKSLGLSQAASFCLSGVRDTFAVIVSFALSWWSDKVRRRGPFVCGQLTMSIVGLVLLAYTKNTASRLEQLAMI